MSARDTLELFRLFRQEPVSPIPFYERLAALAASNLAQHLPGRTVVDVGCGPGHFSRALRAAGATVVPVELDERELRGLGGPPDGSVIGDGSRLPLREGACDGLFSSNMLEHTPDPEGVLREAIRVVRPGGWIWLSWTNWLSPWGGHEMSPWHYLGAERAARMFERRHGEPPKNLPGQSIFPLHINQMLGIVRRTPGVCLLAAFPRYYPSQGWIVRIPGLREFATWNCVLFLQRE